MDPPAGRARRQDSGVAANTAVDAVAASGKAHETLSQFVARILDQLTLSAWLPAGALAFLLMGAIQLGSVVHQPAPVPGVAASLRLAARSIGHISLGGGLLLVAAVVVLTMVTQAFTFEAIRVLEGYWGTSWIAEWAADRRCNRFRRKLGRLEKKLERIKHHAWGHIKTGVTGQRRAQIVKGQPAEITEELELILEARFLGRVPHRAPTDVEEVVLIEFLDSEWEAHVPATIIRRLNNATKLQRDYPAQRNVLPTRLGNVLRHHEDETGITPIESYVEEQFDELPTSMQVSHDQRRTRLDLYCAMVVVIGVATVLAIGVLWGADWYPLVAAGLGTAAMFLHYRAAVASARLYGTTLVILAEWLEENRGVRPA